VKKVVHEVVEMSKRVKLVIDSVVEDLTRIRLSSEDNRTTLNVKVEALRAILGNRIIDEGKSYVITLENIEDFKDLWSGTFDKDFEFQGKKRVKDTTKEDLLRIRRRLRKLRRYR